MNIGIDESGSFVHADDRDSWNCVAAYVYPETDSRRLAGMLRKLRSRHGRKNQNEVKLRDFSETAYIDFLASLKAFRGVLYSVATDAALNSTEHVNAHQAEQVRKILKNVDRMLYEQGRKAVRDLSERVRLLPHQLYVQMVCQTQLIERILHSAIIYFVQRQPATLAKFRWRIDQKNTTPTSYERAYSAVLPAFLQSSSLREPLIMLEGEDYSHFDRFYYPEGREPTYLQDTYGLDVSDADSRKLNIGQLVREDVQFVDSKRNNSVQVADLLASGLRRCLRDGFRDNARVAALLGSLMVQRERHTPPISLVALSDKGRVVDGAAGDAVKIMQRHARAMLTR